MAGGRLAGTGLTGVQELAKAPGVAALAVSISMQGSLCTAHPHGTAEQGLRKEQQRRRG